jgi:hypothetical protein
VVWHEFSQRRQTSFFCFLGTSCVRVAKARENWLAEACYYIMDTTVRYAIIERTAASFVSLSTTPGSDG